jgi:hypothetical protein
VSETATCKACGGPIYRGPSRDGRWWHSERYEDVVWRSRERGVEVFHLAEPAE